MPSVIRICTAAILAMVSIAAHAADLAPAAPPPIAPEEFEKRWQVQGGLYLWGASVNGEVGAKGLGPADIDMGFFEILEDLDFTVMAAAEARYDRFGLFADFIYLNMTDTKSILGGYVDVDADLNLLSAALMGEYRVLQQGRSSVDVMAGARVWRVGGDVHAETVRGRSIRRSDSKSWVDPMVGLKGRWQGDQPFYATGWGMIGGVGVGAKLDWDVLGAVGYEFNEHISVLAGYRAIGIDYSDDGFELDAIMHGPVLSAILRF